MASTAPVQQHQQQLLPGFERLSELAYLYRPAPGEPEGRVPGDWSPRLILLGGWMDAREAHLAKYTTRYQALFPGTPILLLRSFVHHFTPGRRANELAREVAPAVPVIQSLVDDGGDEEAGQQDQQQQQQQQREEAGGRQKPPKILIHVFSNGGSTLLRHIYTLYNNREAALPPRVIIFDSAPGRFQYARSIYAFSISVPYAKTPFFKYILLRLAIHLLCASYWVFQCVFGRRGYLDRTYAAHNDPAISRGDEVRRTYIYSREDRMVDFRDVEEHAAEARRKGIVGGEVRVEKFEGTAHVAHVRGDEDRYWRVVKESWEGGRS